MKKSRVLLISPFPPPFGGIARYSEDLFNSITIKKEFHILKYNADKYVRFRYSKQIDLRNYRRLFNFKNILFSSCILFSFIELAYIVVIKRPFLVHVHTASYFSWWRNVIYMLISKVLGKKVVFHVHNAIDRFYYEESKKIGRIGIKLSLRVPNQVITLSKGIASMIAPFTNTPITPVYNGVNTEIFENIKEWKVINILFAGAVGHEKGTFDLLKAISKIPKHKIKFKCIIVGRGKVEEGKKIVKELGIEDIVTFTGEISEDEKNDFYRKSHIFCLPSYGEGQPISILEGFASGMAIISTTVGSIPEIIKTNNGILVTPGDLNAISESILSLTENIDKLKKICRNNYKLASSFFDNSRVHDDILNIYRSLL